jgi:hypothetical protein
MLVMIAAIACGPSASEIKTAKTASYSIQPEEAFKIAGDVTAETYKIGDVHDDKLELLTAEQWYNPEGGRESPGAGGTVQLVDRSIMLLLIVQVVNDGTTHVVVTPKTFQYISGSPKPRELAPEDPGVPGWVHGRVDELQLAIHKHLEKYTVQR